LIKLNSTKSSGAPSGFVFGIVSRACPFRHALPYSQHPKDSLFLLIVFQFQTDKKKAKLLRAQLMMVNQKTTE